MRHATISSLGVLLALAVTTAACGYDPFSASEPEDEQPPPETASPSPPQPAPFGEIRGEAFEAMLAAESVTITGEVEAGEADLDEMFDGIDEDTSGHLEISGAADGSESQMSFSAGGSSFTQRAVDGDEYFRGEDFAALLVSELDDDVADLVEEDFIAEVVADQWVEFDDAQDPSVFSAHEFIATWQQELENENVSAMEGASETREGRQVWVYTADAGESEFVVAAEGEPYLVSIRDGDSYYHFDEWNSSEAPEPPENVITLQELFEAIAQEQGWPGGRSEETD